MKSSITQIVLIILMSIPVILTAQEATLVLQPDASCGKDALIGSCVPCGYNNTNFGDGYELNSLAWTNSGASSNHRSLMQFDLSEIPVGSIVQSAYLSLYFDPTSSNASGLHSNLSGPNNSFLNKVLTPWDEHTVTWDNQPATTNLDQAIVPASTFDTEDLQIDVRNLMQYFVDNPAMNYGMMLQLETEINFRCLLFSSSDHPDALKHPKLVINYTLPESACFTFQYSGCEGVDALIGSCIPCGYDTSNFADGTELNALAWTNNGASSNHRSLLYWNLNEIPPTATITSAQMSLYYDPTSSNASGFHSSLSGSNDAVLNKVTQAWVEDQVTWNNQPSITSVNQVLLAASSTTTQDYLNIDVTNLVQGMVSNPNNNHGFMLQLANESYFRCLLFASSDHPNVALHPRLEVCYELNTGIAEYNNGIHLLELYPNPSTGAVSIVVPHGNGKSLVELVDIAGRVIYSSMIEAGNRIFPLSDSHAKGVYFVRLLKANTMYQQKLIVQ